MTTATCLARECEDSVKCRGYCQKHYRRRLHSQPQALQWGYVDATEARDHLATLRDLGWTWSQVGIASGLSVSVPFYVYTGRYGRLLHRTNAALLAVPLVPTESGRGSDCTGSRRRVQALQWMGWTLSEIGRRIGTTGQTLQSQLRTSRMSYRRAAQIAAVYDELWDKPGPSRITATKARRWGYAPPSAWDDIDNPLERPKGVRGEAA
jgi:hypothetical protein